ncbi:Non-specific lipid-transfer protein-like protein [Drosera capensis]
MAMMMKVVAVAAAIAVMAVAVAPGAEAALSCNSVIQGLFPCLGWIQGGGVGGPPGQCCSGIQTLYRAAATTPDRQTVCGCLKNLAASYPGFVGTAAGLPGKCGVRIPYKISTSTDCSKIK